MSNKKVPESVRELTEEFVSRMSELYGERLDKVILFGSYARGEEHEDSDVDYLVVLKDEAIRTLKEISILSPVTGSLGLKYNLWISAIPLTAKKFYSEKTPLNSNVKKEGILL